MAAKKRKRDALERLRDVADDAEHAILDALCQRAGFTWECIDDDGDSHWTNTEDDKVCGGCRKPRPRRRRQA